jgi:hypothetical protein
VSGENSLVKVREFTATPKVVYSDANNKNRMSQCRECITGVEHLARRAEFAEMRFEQVCER